MSSYKVAKEGKQIMTQLIAERKLEEAALIGLLYQTPIRIGDAVTLQKSDLDGRKVIKIQNKCGCFYINLRGKPYRITRQLKNLLLSLTQDSDMIFTKSKIYYQHWFRKNYKNFSIYDFRRAYCMNEELLQYQRKRKPANPLKRKYNTGEVNKKRFNEVRKT